MEGQKVLLGGGTGCPALEAMATSEYFEATSRGDGPYTMGLKVAHPLPCAVRYPEIAAAWAEELQPLWIGQATVADVTAKIDARVDRILSESRPAAAWLLPLTPRG